MSNALTLFDNAPNLPADIEQYFGEGNIKDRPTTVPSVTYGGKIWTLNVNGEKHKMTKRDDDGDEIPVSILRVVVLDYAERMGRTYYPGEYDPDKPGQPECWSDDGRKPHASVPEPKCVSCEACPLAAKGSKISAQGKMVTACSQHRMVVVAPIGKLGQFPPLRLKLAVTSNYDKKSPELEAAGWYAFQQYTELLRARGVKHSARLVTKMKFDPTVDYPKVIFSPDRWLETSELEIVGPMSKLPEVKQLLSGTWTPNGADGTKIEAPKAAAPAPVQKAAIAIDDDEDEAPVVKKVAKPKAVVAKDDEDSIVVPLKKAAPKAESKKVEPAATSEDLDALLGEWGE